MTNQADPNSSALERLQRAQVAGRIGTWDWDVRTNKLDWDGVEAIHGLPPGAFAGTFEAYTRDMHPDDRDVVLGTIRQARDTGNDVDVEYRIVLPDGSTRWVLGRGTCFFNERGEIVRLAGTCQDITARKNIEEAMRFLAQAGEVLASSLDYQETLAGVAGLCVPYLADWCAIYVTAEGSTDRVAVVHANPEKAEVAREYLQGYPLSEAPALGPNAVIRTGEPVLIDRSPGQPSTLGEQPEYAAILQKLVTHHILAVPLTARGKTLGALSLVFGESGRRFSESQLELALELGRRAGIALDNARLFAESQRIQEELRLSIESKDEFLGILSHEIRTPTTTIYGSARLLKARHDRLSEETRMELITSIEEEADRLARLIENLLAIARMDVGREILFEWVDLDELCQKVVEEYRRRRPHRQLSLHPDATPLLNAAPTYIEQVLRNLIENADKYSPPDQPIEVRLRVSEEAVDVSVLDRGPGIAEAEIPLIFGSFFRSSSTAGKAPGKGLGLTVCKRLIQAHNGAIWAENRPGGGLQVTFSLRLPQANDDLTPDNTQLLTS